MKSALRPRGAPGASGVITALILAAAVALATGPAPTRAADSSGGPGRHEAGLAYEKGPRTRDGTGKYFLGREIARVMGHLGAGWLERPGREREERTDLLLATLDLAPGDVVADIGAGTGYFALPMAARLDGGRVLAVDLQPEMLDIVRRRAAAMGLENVEPVLATETDPHLPEGAVDVVLMVDAYHEFSHPLEVMQAVVRSLTPGGRVYLVEYRAEDRAVPIKRLHKMSEAQARREMEAAGLVWVETLDLLPQQHVLVFRRAAETD